MTDVYKIGVSVVLANLVSAELLKIGEQFGFEVDPIGWTGTGVT